MSAALGLIPDFLLIVLGAVLFRTLIEDGHFWVGLEKLVYFVLFPAMLFRALTRAELALDVAMPLLAAGLVVLLSGFVAGLASRRLLAASPLAFASRLQCAYRFNTYIGFAIASSAHGEAGLSVMSLLAGAMVPVANLLAVGMLAREREVDVWRELGRNPLVLSTLAGLAANLLGLRLGGLVDVLFDRMGQSAITLGLICVGAALRFHRIEGRPGGMLYLIMVKLLLLPLVAMLLADAIGLPARHGDILVLFAALPVASSAYILTARMGGDGHGVAWLITASTLLSMLTLPLWLASLG